MIETQFGKLVRRSAKNIKSAMNEYKKAAEKAGVSDKYGRNGPIGRYGFDLAMPKMSEGMFDQLNPDSGEAEARVRQVLRFAYGKSANSGKTVTDRLSDVNKYLGQSDNASTFSNLLQSSREWDGKGDMYEKVVEGAQNISKLRSNLADTNVMAKAKRTQRNAGEVLKASPVSVDAKATANTAKNLNRTGSLAEVAEAKRRQQENQDG